MERYVVVTGANSGLGLNVRFAQDLRDLSVRLSALRPEECSLLRAPSVQPSAAING